MSGRVDWQRGLGPTELRVRIWTSSRAGNWEKQEPQEGSQGADAPEITQAPSGGGMGTFLGLSARNSPNSQKGSLFHEEKVLDIILALWTFEQKNRGPERKQVPL